MENRVALSLYCYVLRMTIKCFEKREKAKNMQYIKKKYIACNGKTVLERRKSWERKKL